MEKGQEACPSCGAQVFPEEAQCPVCGHRLHAHGMARLLVGLAGTALALVAGAGVWWLLAVPPQQQVAPVSQQPVTAPAPAATPEPAAPASDIVPVPRSAPPPAWPANGARDQPAEMPAEDEVAPPDASASAPVTPSTGPVIPATAEERRAFARESEASLTANGLQLTVSTSGENDTTLVMTFAYPATTTAELIIAGPFPRQCERRGFKTIRFVDTGEVTLVYDIATQTLSKR